MSYNYISGNSNVLTEPQAKSCLSSKLQGCSISASSPLTQQNFKPFTKPPACDFSFRTPNFFYPPQHTHSLKSNGFRGNLKTGRASQQPPQKNISFDEVFQTQPQITVTKQQSEQGTKHVSFDESVQLNSPTSPGYIPKSPLIPNTPKIPPMTLPKPQGVFMDSNGPHIPNTMMDESFNSSSSSRTINTSKGAPSNMPFPGVKPSFQQENNQSFYQESSFQTISTISESSSSMPSNLSAFPPQDQIPSLSQPIPSPAPPTSMPTSNLKPAFILNRNLSPAPFGEPMRNPSPVKHVSAPRMEAPSSIPAPPPAPFKKESPYSSTIGAPILPPFAPMEMNELSPIVKEKPRASSPREPIILANGEMIPSDTKVSVKDQNAWYRQMSKTIHGLKGDMPMNRAPTWHRP